MAARQGFMVEKLSRKEIDELIKRYTSLGWQFHGLSEHGRQLLLTLDWPFDSEPPKLG